MQPSNEAEPSQLDIARGEGDAYRRALEAMDRESGAIVKPAGEYVVAFVQEEAEGLYALGGGELVWREAAEEANGHLEIAVADAADGRFVPNLDIRLTLRNGERELFTRDGARGRAPGDGRRHQPRPARLRAAAARRARPWRSAPRSG